MEQLVFSITGMTCTTCSNTIHRYKLLRGISRIPNVSHVAVALVSEKLIVIGEDLDSQAIISKVRVLGFDAEERLISNIKNGEITFILSSDIPSSLDSDLTSIIGITSAIVNGPEVIVNFIPEIIKAREVACTIEAITRSKLKVKNSDLSNEDMTQKQRKTMNSWLKEFAFSAVFTLSIVIFSLVFTRTANHKNIVSFGSAHDLPIYNLVVWVLATPVQFIFGARFYKGAYSALMNKSANMDLLVVLSTTSAYSYGTAMNILYLIGYHPGSISSYIISAHTFETSSLLISIILLGKYLESRAKKRTTDALTKLAKLQAPYAVLIESTEEKEIEVCLLEVGDSVKVYPGSSIPTDGKVIEGEAWVNESSMTGESSLVQKSPGKQVFGGTINVRGCIIIKVEKIGKETALAHIIDLIENAQATKPPIQKVADTISKYFVPTIIFIALATWAIWLLMVYTSMPEGVKNRYQNSGETRFLFAFKFGISVLVIACPCGLGLAVPTAVIVATGVAARYGIMIKDAEALENASNISKVIFDKTGTLTSGKPKVVNFTNFSERSDEEIWNIIVCVEKNSEHPIGKALCEDRESPMICRSFNSIEGCGIEAVINQGTRVLIGNERLFANNWVLMSQEDHTVWGSLENDGKTVIGLAIENRYVCCIALQDEHLVRPEAKSVITELNRQGYEVWMITGDNERCAHKVAKEVGIPTNKTIANCCPSDKKEIIQELQYSKRSKYSSKDECSRELNHMLIQMQETIENDTEKDKKDRKGILFVGDGVNDSPSLVQADIGLAIGGTDIAMEASDIVMLKSDLRDVLVSLEIAKITLKRIKYNFFWAFIYNVCAIPLAAGGIYVWTGFYINSVLAASAMALSSIAVVMSSLLLNTYKPKHTNII